MKNKKVTEECLKCGKVTEFEHFDCECCGGHQRICSECNFTEDLDFSEIIKICSCGRDFSTEHNNCPGAITIRVYSC